MQSPSKSSTFRDDEKTRNITVSVNDFRYSPSNRRIPQKCHYRGKMLACSKLDGGINMARNNEGDFFHGNVSSVV